MIYRKFTLYFAPDTGVSAPSAPAVDVGTADISVPMVSTPPRTTQDVVLPGNENLENAPILKDLPKETRKVRGPQDFGMQSPEESSELMGLTPKRERGPDGKFVPKTPQSSPSTQPARPKATTPPAAKTPTPTAQPAKTATQPAAPTPAPAGKIKIGDEEKTQEEWAKELATLKAGKAQDLPPAAKVETPAKTEAETAAEAAAQQQRETKFVTERAKEYTMPAAELDEILVGGDAGAAKLGTLLARAEMRGRQFSIDQQNKLADHIIGLVSPLLDQNQTVQSLMQETAFLGAHPDIKSNPQGAATFREMKATMEIGYQTIQAKVAAGTASRSEQAWAMLYEDMTPEQRMQSIAEHTRAKLGPASPVTAKPAAPAPAKPAAPVVTERPLGGDRPGGGGSAPKGETAEQRMVREVNASRGIST